MKKTFNLKIKKMKTKITMIITIVFILQSYFVYAQFNEFNIGPIWFGRTNVPPLNNDISAISIGNFTTLPSAAWHINTNKINTPYYGPGNVFRTDGPSNVLNSWRLWTGGQTDAITPSEKGMIFCYGANSVHPADTLNFSIQASTRDMTFHTMPLMPYTVIAKERMRIVGPQRWVNSSNYFSREGNVGIGTANPLTKLHIGEDGDSLKGFRDWMDSGIFFGGHLEASNALQNHMYVGIKYTDSFDAVINWGHRPIDSSGATHLLFLFTSADNPIHHLQSQVPGNIEVGRMTSSGNWGRMGIGGDPNINRYSYILSPDPQNTLEINSPAVSDTSSVQALSVNITQGFNAPNPWGGTGYSGLRFTDLTAASTPCAPSRVILSLDSNGDVILVPNSGAMLLECLVVFIQGMT